MKLGRIAGVYFKINSFFLLLCIIYGYLGLLWEVLIIFSAVLIHEIAHTIMGLMMGIKVAEIELFPFGGQAQIEDFTGLDPEKEIYVALAGPVISIFTASIFYFLEVYPAGNNLLLFIRINFLLGFFNLLPALPLDGGRIIRAVLSRIMGYKKATQRAALMGKIIATGILGYGIYLTCLQFSGANFIIIGIFLFWAANREGAFMEYAFMRFLVNKKNELSKKGFLSCRQVVSRPETRIKSILNSTRPTCYTLVVVIDDNHQIIAMHGEAQLIECLFEKGPQATLEDC